jgi:geranylgeranyl pyrophosphate synthase
LEALDKYADSMALAFQIHDDMMDLSKTMKDAGTYAKNKTVEAKKYLEKAKLNEEGFKFFNELADFVVERKV